MTTQIFPQPLFADDEGLTLSGCSVSGGQLVFNGSGNPASCSVDDHPTIEQGQKWAYSLFIESGEDCATLRLMIGGVAAVIAPHEFQTLPPINPPQVVSGMVEIAGTPANQDIRIFDPDGTASAVFAHCLLYLT